MLHAQHVVSSIGTHACAPIKFSPNGGMIVYHGMMYCVMRQ